MSLTLRLYRTYNRGIFKFSQTVLIIEIVLIIAGLEKYLFYGTIFAFVQSLFGNDANLISSFCNV